MHLPILIRIPAEFIWRFPADDRFPLAVTTQQTSERKFWGIKAQHIPSCIQLAPLPALSSWVFNVHSSPKHPDLVYDHTQTPQRSDRCPLSTRSQGTRGREENTCSSANQERSRRKDGEDCDLGFGKQRHRKLQKKRREGKRDVCQLVCQRCLNTRNNSERKKGSTKIDRMSKRLWRDERNEGTAWIVRSNKKRWRQTVKRS